MAAAPSEELSPGIYQEVDSVQSSIATPNIGITAPTHSPSIKLHSGQHGETTKSSS